VESIGCKVLDHKKFMLVADCNGTIIVKGPESRVRIIVPTGNLEDIVEMTRPPPDIAPRSVTVGRFSKQGTTSRLIQLGGLDEVEYIFGENELSSMTDERVRDAMNRIERANKFTFMTSHGGIDPPIVIKKEIDTISDLLVNQIEKHVAKKTGNNIICGSKVPIHKSWNTFDNEKYRFSIKVNCKIPAIIDPVTKKIDSIGAWNTISESDRFYVKSIMPSGKDVFLTGLKLKSEHGINQIEFEVIDDKVIKKKGFIDKLNAMLKNNVNDVSKPVNTNDFLPEPVL
jgi:hypothetical protein